jgi:tetratricopeptide (TPR) repeat protein
MAQLRANNERARSHYDAARGFLEAIGETRASARLSARLGEIDYLEDHLVDGIERMEAAFSLLAKDEQDENLATLAAQLGRLHLFAGNKDLAAERLEFALGIAERLQLREEFSQALNTKGVLLDFDGRIEEGTVLMRHALAVALENDLSSAALRAYNNLAVFLIGKDNYDEAAEVFAAAIELARRVGDRGFERWAVYGVCALMAEDGRWDEALSLIDEFGPDATTAVSIGRLLSAVSILLNRGNVAEVREMFGAFLSMEATDEIQTRAAIGFVRGLMLRAEGKNEEALQQLSEVVGYESEIGSGVKFAQVAEIEVALRIDRTLAEQRVAELESRYPGNRSPFLETQSRRFRAALDPGIAAECFVEAEAGFRALDRPFWLAVTLLEHAEWLSKKDGPDAVRPLCDEARAIFTRLGAKPWLERLGELDHVQRLSG